MSTELAEYLSSLPETFVQKTEQADIDAITKSGDWLPTLHVTTSQTGQVIDQKINMGRFMIRKSKDSFKDLGVEIEILVLGFHARAMDTRGGAPLSYYNHTSPEFQNVVEISKTSNSKCFYGPEFLCWLPSENLFCLLLCGSITARKEANNILTAMNEGRPANEFGPVPIRLSVRLIDDGKNKWHAFSTVPMSTPLPPPTDVFKNSLAETMQTFRNPVDSKVTSAPAGAQRDR